LACFAIATTLSWPDVKRLTGIEGEIGFEEVRRTLAAVKQESLPRRVTVGAVQCRKKCDGRVLTMTYRESDPRWIREEVFSTVHRFEGRTVDEAVELIASHDGVVLTSDDIRELIDLQVLIAEVEADEDSTTRE
jgi:hypothetical protein